MNLSRLIALGCLALFTVSCARPLAAQEAAAPATQPAAVEPGQTKKLPHLTVDVKNRQVRVECISLGVDAPLEFFVVTTGGPTHESVLASRVKPSDLHLAMLMIGLEPGEPVRYSQTAERWFPPTGPRIHLSVEFEQNGKTVHMPATRLMRHLRTRKEMPATTWIFCGSRVMDDGNYAADVTGYITSVVNFDLTVIDVPDLRSNANETLEWETNTDVAPPEGAAVTLIIEPAGNDAAAEDTPAAAAPADAPIDVVLINVAEDGSVTLDRQPIEVAQITTRLKEMKQERPVRVRVSSTPQTSYERVDTVLTAAQAAGAEVEVATVPANMQTETVGSVQLDEQRMNALRQRWEEAVRPNRDAVRQAAQAHYDVITQLRQEQQRLIDEADRIQRLIDQLEREYQDITTPRPREQR